MVLFENPFFQPLEIFHRSSQESTRKIHHSLTMKIKTLRAYEIVVLINSSRWNDVKEGLRFVEDVITKIQSKQLLPSELLPERTWRRALQFNINLLGRTD